MTSAPRRRPLYASPMSQSLSKVLQAEALFQQGDADGAKALLTRALHTKPNDAEACNLLALIQDATGDRERRRAQQNSARLRRNRRAPLDGAARREALVRSRTTR